MTLWEVDHTPGINEFHFRQNVGLHHFALEIASETALASTKSACPGANVELMPEPVGGGPRKHMIINEPGSMGRFYILGEAVDRGYWCLTLADSGGLLRSIRTRDARRGLATDRR